MSDTRQVAHAMTFALPDRHAGTYAAGTLRMRAGEKWRVAINCKAFVGSHEITGVTNVRSDIAGLVLTVIGWDRYHAKLEVDADSIASDLAGRIDADVALSDGTTVVASLTTELRASV